MNNYELSAACRQRLREQLQVSLLNSSHSSSRDTAKVAFPRPQLRMQNDLQGLTQNQMSGALHPSIKLGGSFVGERFSSGQVSLDYLRKRLLINIECRLQEKHPMLDKDKIKKVARRIEQLLFQETHKAGTTRQDYTDLANLEERLSRLLRNLLQSKTKKVSTIVGTSSSSSMVPEQRVQALHHREVIRSHVVVADVSEGGGDLQQQARNQVIFRGMENEDDYNRAQHLVQAIKRLRLQNAGYLECENSDCQRYQCGVCCCNRPPLPPPVYNLYYNINLVQAMEDVAMADLSKISPDQWQAWIREAEWAVKKFQQWRQERAL